MIVLHGTPNPRCGHGAGVGWRGEGAAANGSKPGVMRNQKFFHDSNASMGLSSNAQVEVKESFPLLAQNGELKLVGLESRWPLSNCLAVPGGRRTCCRCPGSAAGLVWAGAGRVAEEDGLVGVWEEPGTTGRRYAEGAEAAVVCGRAMWAPSLLGMLVVWLGVVASMEAFVVVRLGVRVAAEARNASWGVAVALPTPIARVWLWN